MVLSISLSAWLQISTAESAASFTAGWEGKFWLYDRD